MSEPPSYTPFYFAETKKQTDTINSYMSDIYMQINENIQSAVRQGLYTCKIFLNFGNADKKHIKLIRDAIKTNYKSNMTKIKFKHHVTNIYKLTITWK